MHLPVKAHYAALAMLALASEHHAGRLMPARQIADHHKIPSQFLGQILQQLRAAGLITSTRGANGGFQLSRLPETISLADIVDSVCPPSRSGCSELSTHSELGEVLTGVWHDLEDAQRERLSQVTLAELLGRCKSADNTMFYI